MRLQFAPRTEQPVKICFSLTSGSFAVTLSAERRSCSRTDFYGYMNQQKGDVNLDQAVDIRDIIRIKKYFSGTISNGQFSEINADCNEDYSVNAHDLAALCKMLLE